MPLYYHVYKEQQCSAYGRSGDACLRVKQKLYRRRRRTVNQYASTGKDVCVFDL